MMIFMLWGDDIGEVGDKQTLSLNSQLYIFTMHSSLTWKPQKRDDALYSKTDQLPDLLSISD